MTIRLAPEDEAKVAEMIGTGGYADSAEVIHDAIAALEDRKRVEKLRALIDEGEADYARGDYVESTPELANAIWDRAKDKVRLGSLIPDHVRS